MPLYNGNQVPLIKKPENLEGDKIVEKRKRSNEEDASKSSDKRAKTLKVYLRRQKLHADPSSCIRSVNDSMSANKKMDPIDDSMVQATYEDRLSLMKRPLPRTDFDVPIDCVGDLLMVWDFCVSFGRFLNLSPFSLFDFESTLCYKGRPPLIIVECCCALLNLLLKEKENPNPKVTETNWTECLCGFLETCCGPQLSAHATTLKQGRYRQLEVRVKLAILRELVAEVIGSTAFKNKVDDNFEERKALAAVRRDEAVFEARRRREEIERMRGGEVTNDHMSDVSLSKKQNQTTRLSDDIEAESSSEDDITLLNKSAIRRMMKQEIKEAIKTKSAEEKKKFMDAEIEKRPLQNIPLGKDRNHNRYWFLRHDGRIYVEGPNFKHWGYYQTKDELDALVGSLNTKGVREKALKKQLKTLYKRICLAIEKRPKEEMPSDGPSLSFLEYENTWKEV